MSLYLDASLLVALFVIDPTSARADAFLSEKATVLVISDFGAAEFSSAVARRVRMRHLTRDEGRVAFAEFDTWTGRSVLRRELTTADIASAERIIRRLDVNLRAPDAIQPRDRTARRRDAGDLRSAHGRECPRTRHGGRDTLRVAGGPQSQHC